MESVREKWTDERLDDLNHRVDVGFRESRDEFRALRSEMKAGFDRMDLRFDSMQRVMLQGFIAMTAAILAAFGGLAALMTQL